jgi:hypothetical protein
MFKFTNKTYPPIPNMPGHADKRTRLAIENLWFAMCDVGKYIENITSEPSIYPNAQIVEFHMPKLNAKVQCICVEHVIRLWYLENKNNQ